MMKVFGAKRSSLFVIILTLQSAWSSRSLLRLHFESKPYSLTARDPFITQRYPLSPQANLIALSLSLS
jgi:hypothetical protein